MDKPARWTCNECGTSQDSPTKELARADWQAHWNRYHQEVPF